jgi:hypothetical protein
MWSMKPQLHRPLTLPKLRQHRKRQRTKKAASPASAPNPGTKPKAAQSPASQTGDTTAQTVSPDAPPLPLTMNPILWIGFGFLVAFVVFLGFTIYKPPPRGSQGRATMRIFSSLCCGFAGGFLTGAAIFNATFTHALGKVGIFGSAGIALFLTVFFFYDKMPDGELNVPDGVALTIPKNCKFSDAADIVGTITKAGMDYRVLNRDELGAAMKEQSIEAKSWEQLLESLRNVTVEQGIRPYTVKKENGSYLFKI